MGSKYASNILFMLNVSCDFFFFLKVNCVVENKEKNGIFFNMELQGHMSKIPYDTLCNLVIFSNCFFPVTAINSPKAFIFICELELVFEE